MDKKFLFLLLFVFFPLSSNFLFAYSDNENDSIATLGHRPTCIQNSPSQKVTICKYYPPQDEINTSVHTDGELEIHFVDYIPEEGKAKDLHKNIFPSSTDVVDVIFDKTSLDESAAVTDKKILIYNRNDVFYENGFYQSIDAEDKKKRSESSFSHGEGDKIESTFVFNTRGVGTKTLCFTVVGSTVAKDNDGNVICDANGNPVLNTKLDRDGQPYRFPVKIHVRIDP